jgi:hypothetical protein
MQQITPLLAAPKIAGLLPASCGTSTFCFTDQRLAGLAHETRQRLITSCQQLFTVALDILTQPDEKQVLFNIACTRFAIDIERLATAPTRRSLIPTIHQPLRFRSRAEMDAEVQILVDQMRANFSQCHIKYKAGEVSHD